MDDSSGGLGRRGALGFNAERKDAEQRRRDAEDKGGGIARRRRNLPWKPQ